MELRQKFYQIDDEQKNLNKISSYGSTQTMPFARPIFKDLLGAIDFAISKNYPARGEYTGSV